MTDLAATLRTLHVPGSPLVLPNAWDAASAQAVVRASFPVVATSSAAVAAVLGWEDHEAMPADEAFAAVTRVARSVPGVPVTADLEAGYGLSADELVERLLATGAVGCNLEDTDRRHGDGLVDAEQHAARLAEVRGVAGDRLVINARTDAYLQRDWSPKDQLAETLRRGRRYLDSGADYVYPIGLADEAAIAEIVTSLGSPINVLARSGAPSTDRLAELGVARVSYGSGIFRLAASALEAVLNDLRQSGGVS